MSSSRDDIIIAMRYALLKKGAKQKFSLFFLILFSILIITLDKFSITPITSVRSALNDIVYRVTVVASFPERLISVVSSSIVKHFNIYNETRDLKVARYLSGRIDRDTAKEDQMLTVWSSEATKSSAYSGIILSDLEYGVKTYHDHLRKIMPVLGLQNAPTAEKMSTVNTEMLGSILI